MDVAELFTRLSLVSLFWLLVFKSSKCLSSRFCRLEGQMNVDVGEQVPHT